MDLTKTDKIAQVELRFCNSESSRQLPKVRCLEAAFAVLAPFFSECLEHRECFYCLYLNCAKRCLGIACIAQGGIDRCTVDQRLIFQTGLLLNATSFIMAHNHPSGVLEPSNADLALTDKLKLCGELMGIELVDHLILSADGLYSFKQEGRL